MSRLPLQSDIEAGDANKEIIEIDERGNVVLQDLGEPNVIDEEAPQPGCIQRCLHGCVQRLCPGFLRWMRMMGYDQVFEIRGTVRCALMLACWISFFYCCIWFAEIVSFKCIRLDKNGEFDCPESFIQCVWEFFGILIYGASFADSVRMIAHYDDDRQVLLKKKWDEMKALNADTKRVLQKAEDNVSKLQSQVSEEFAEQLAKYPLETFFDILKYLEERDHFKPGDKVKMRSGEIGTILRLSQRNARVTLQFSNGNIGEVDFPEIVADLMEKLRGILVDISKIAEAAIHVWSVRAPEVYAKVEKETVSWPKLFSSWDRWIERQFNRLVVNEGHHVPSNHGQFPFEREDIGIKGGARRIKNAEELENIMARIAHSSASRDDYELLANQIAQEALLPLNDLLRVPEQMKLEQNAKIQKANEIRSRERLSVGCGCWSGFETPQCFLPRLLAFVTCYCCLCPKSCRKRCVKAAGYDPPKKMSVGFFHIKIFTKLQERLIQGLIFATLFAAFYIYTIYRSSLHEAMWQSPCSADEFDAHSLSSTRACYTEIGRKIVGLVAMFAYIPALVCCLLNVRRLDDVMETIETIWALEDIQRTVHAFSSQMDGVDDQFLLFLGIRERVFPLVECVSRFAGEFRKAGYGMSQLVMCLSDCLENAEIILEPAEQWVRLPRDQQKDKKAQILKVKQGQDDTPGIRETYFASWEETKQALVQVPNPPFGLHSSTPVAESRSFTDTFN